MQESKSTSTSVLGSAMLIIGWIIGLTLCGFLYNKLMYAPKAVIVETSATKVKITLQRQANGHFFLPILVNGKKVNFLIDTGATRTAITTEVAKQIGLSFDYHTKAATANGEIDAYTTKISVLDFGSVKLFDIPAIILPNMDVAGLLGMNVLQQFNIIQTSDTMALIFSKPQ